MVFLRLFIFLTAFATFGTSGIRAQGPYAISGYVLSAQRGNGPVEGCTVSLVHPSVGRSVPSFSAVNGFYYFVNVPPQPLPYFLEVYWGQQLIFRNQIFYQGAPVQFNILLP
jgi:hypothetical protein